METLALRDMSRSELAEAADANLVEHAGWVHRRLPTMRVVEDPGLTLIDSGVPCDTFNVVCRARLRPEDAPGRARAAIEHFTTVGRPFSWWVGPADRPAELGDRLLDLGLARNETELAMAADLAGLRTGDGPPGALRIRRVRTEAELRAFARLLAGAVDPPDDEVLRFYKLAAAPFLGAHPPQWLYLGLLGDDAVAAGQLTVGGGVVGLYNVFTSPAHRGRGFGTALTLRPLIDARAAGHRTAVLQATAEGAGIYERAGFRAFGRITEYKPPRPSPSFGSKA